MAAKKYEALAWLNRTTHTGALGFNVLRTTSRAIRFVQELYALGAAKVHVTNVGQAHEGGEVADTLFVQLPRQTNWARVLQVVYRMEPDDVRLVSTTTIKLWWD